MRTQEQNTPTQAIYWTTLADEAFFKELCDHVSCPVDDVGLQIVIGSHAGRIEAIARVQGSPRVNRQMVESYFRRLHRGGK